MAQLYTDNTIQTSLWHRVVQMSTSVILFRNTKTFFQQLNSPIKIYRCVNIFYVEFESALSYLPSETRKISELIKTPSLKNFINPFNKQYYMTN